MDKPDPQLMVDALRLIARDKRARRHMDSTRRWTALQAERALPHAEALAEMWPRMVEWVEYIAERDRSPANRREARALLAALREDKPRPSPWTEPADHVRKDNTDA